MQSLDNIINMENMFLINLKKDFSKNNQKLNKDVIEIQKFIRNFLAENQWGCVSSEGPAALELALVLTVVGSFCLWTLDITWINRIKSLCCLVERAM